MAALAGAETLRSKVPKSGVLTVSVFGIVVSVLGQYLLFWCLDPQRNGAVDVMGLRDKCVCDFCRWLIGCHVSLLGCRRVGCSRRWPSVGGSCWRGFVTVACLADIVVDGNGTALLSNRLPGTVPNRMALIPK